MNTQIEKAVKDATERIMDKGSDDADERDVTWASAGFIAEAMREAVRDINKAVQDRPLIKIDGKRSSVIGAGIGAGILTLAQTVWGMVRH